MRRFLAISPLLLLTACVFEIHDDGPYQDDLADVTLRYTFNGQDCTAAGVERIQVELEGLYQGDYYIDELSCARFGDGLYLENLFPDTYEVRVEGRDAMGNVLYQMSRPERIELSSWQYDTFTFDIPGDGGTLTVYWTFDGSGACENIEDVRVTLRAPDGQIYDDARYDCDFGGVIYDVLPPGLWSIDLTALDDMGRTQYRSPEQNIAVFVGANNEYTLDLLSMW